MLDFEAMKQRISKAFPEVEFEEFRNQLAARVPREKILDFMRFVKEDPELAFDYLTDVTGVDYLKMERIPRFDVVYHIYSFKNNQRLRVKVGVPEEDMDVPSMTVLWNAANWLEREAFEMFGFNFVGHPDLRHLLLPDVFYGHPLRKDYPLEGKGERDVVLHLK
ncbi:MAG: NADH-quinone oxidoreductase subunit C [Calditrichaeota bacterium]|nr:MAG: NADH-quinone oxidoreductase subunit C [Calditrichota bacterium]